MGRRILLAVLTLFAATSAAQAQGTGRIVGQVTSAEGNRPIPLVTIVIVGTTRGAITDSLGRYTLADVPAGTRRIQTRRVGMVSNTQSVTVTAGQAATLNFSLVASPIQLTEIKTVGYGAQEARAVTAAVTTVTAEKLRDIPTQDPMKALQGRVAGVEIVSSSNEPGAGSTVNIRGVRSISSSNNPLYVVDGIPISGGIEDFNPAIIETIDVLKDAAATAIYGSRGANGVILVTTKKAPMDGRNRSSYSVDSYYGNQSPYKLVKMMNMAQFTKYLQDANRLQVPARDTALAVVLNSQSFVPGTQIPKRLYAFQNGIETDWQRITLHDASQKNFQGGISGSSPDTRYNISGNYFTQVGMIWGEGYDRGSAFASVDHTANKFRVGLSTNLSRIVRNLAGGQGAFGSALGMTPYGQPFNYTTPDSAAFYDTRPDDDALNINPLLESRSKVNEALTHRVFGSAYAEYQLSDGVALRMNFGPDYTNDQTGCYNDSWVHTACSGSGQGSLPSASLSQATDFQYTLDNLITINRDLGSKQHFDITGLYSIQKDRNNNLSEAAQQLPYTTQLWYDLGSGIQQPQTSRISEWALQSFMGRVNYTLFDRYTLSFTGRNDGSSRLAPGHKWAFFPSYSFSWQLGDEAFMRRFSFINSLKLRGSYGTTGNTSVSPYATLGTLSAQVYSFGNTLVRGYRPGAIPNPDLTWEKTDQSDFGFDFAVFNNRISGSFDGYKVNTQDLILTRTLPATSGFSSVLQNIGSTKGNGWEVGLSTVNVEKWHGFRWSSDINWSTNANEIVSLQSGTTQDINNRWFVGYPIHLGGARSVFFDYKYGGIWQTADSVARLAYNAANGAKALPGDPWVVDTNGDGKINADDRIILGNSYPSWIGSLSNRISRGGFDISALITAKWNYLFTDGLPRGYQGRYGNIADMDYWTPENPTNKNPAPNVGDQGRPYAGTRLLRDDGSHWRIRNITAGYTTGERLAGRIGASSLRIYSTIQEPYVHSSYEGTDPETAGAAPNVRTLLLGTNIVW
ncbi:MAG: SusC/RagA family TonB-linked outer membrane protein [Gemmatimonadota bacterium]